MKRIFLIVYCMIVALCSSHAQHFEFMGIPIDGSIEAFDAKLKAKGFVKSKDFGEFDTKTERYYDGRYGDDKYVLYLLYIDRKNSIINNAINRGDI